MATNKRATLSPVPPAEADDDSAILIIDPPTGSNLILAQYRRVTINNTTSKIQLVHCICRVNGYEWVCPDMEGLFLLDSF